MVENVEESKKKSKKEISEEKIGEPTPISPAKDSKTKKTVTQVPERHSSRATKKTKLFDPSLTK